MSPKHFLDLDAFEAKTLRSILDDGAQMKRELKAGKRERKLDGKTLATIEGEVRLQTADARLIEHAPDWRVRLLAVALAHEATHLQVELAGAGRMTLQMDAAWLRARAAETLQQRRGQEREQRSERRVPSRGLLADDQADRARARAQVQGVQRHQHPSAGEGDVRDAKEQE